MGDPLILPSPQPTRQGQVRQDVNRWENDLKKSSKSSPTANHVDLAQEAEKQAKRCVHLGLKKLRKLIS